MDLSLATLILALVTTIATIVSGVMAYYTRRMALSAEEEISLSESHHMDSVKPILLLEVSPAIERSDIISSLSIDGSAINNNFATYSVAAKLINVGTGVALDITLLVRFENSSRKEIKADIPPVNANCDSVLRSLKFHTPNFDSDFLDASNQFKPGEYQSAPGQSWVIYISYKDIYGRSFYTKHPKNSQERWTTIRVGKIPPGKSKKEIENELKLAKDLSLSTIDGTHE